MATIVIATTPNNASAATMAIMAIDAFLSCSLDEWFIFCHTAPILWIDFKATKTP